MSSSGEVERFAIGAHVDATDGRCGRLTRVIVNPGDESLTHLAVEPGHHKELARLVPVDLVASVEDDLIRLDCTKKQFEQLDAAKDIRFLADPTPTYAAIDMPLGHQRGPMFIDRVPPGEVDIRRGDPVHATDGSIGAVQGLVIDPADDHVTHVLLQEGHIWGRKQVAIPIGAANRVGDEIRVDLTKDEIEALPPVSIR
jgi:sporulation protein YlmC with PRC-barrel domain